MAARHGPLLRSLIYDKALEADDLMRPEIADSHQGQGVNRSSNRPDRFAHPAADQHNHLAAGGVHRLSYRA
jgi:hypothetical protein